MDSGELRVLADRLREIADQLAPRETDAAGTAMIRQQQGRVPEDGPAPCGCSPYTICRVHYLARQKGCICHGSCFSSECPVSRHAEWASWRPDLDPALAP